MSNVGQTHSNVAPCPKLTINPTNNLIAFKEAFHLLAGGIFGSSAARLLITEKTPFYVRRDYVWMKETVDEVDNQDYDNKEFFEGIETEEELEEFENENPIPVKKIMRRVI